MQTFTPSDKARKVAFVRAAGSGRTSKLAKLANDDAFKGWKIGATFDVYSDLCEYNEKIAPLIDRLARSEYVPSKERAVLRSALGSMQQVLRTTLKNDKASLVVDNENGPILLDEIDGKPVTRYLVRREA